jgi:branched-chain amino acid transport system substrate-binding protein
VAVLAPLQGRPKEAPLKHGSYRLIAGAFAVAAIAVAAPACGSSDDSSTDSASTSDAGGLGTGPIKAGYIAALSGFLAPFDTPVTQGSKLAVTDINAKGGVAGTNKIELDVQDMKSDAATVVTVGQQLLDSGSKVLLPGCNTDFQVAGASVAQQANTLMVSPCNADPTISAKFPVYFAVGPGGNRQAAAMADYVSSQGAKNVYILDAPDFLFVKLITKYFTEAAKTRGLTISGKDTFKIGATDFGSQIAKLKSANPKPDVIVTGMFAPDIAIFVKQLRAAGVDTPVQGTDGVDTSVTLKTGGSAVNGLTFTTFAFPTPGSPAEKFAKAFKAAYGSEPDGAYPELGYNAIAVMSAAMAKAKSTDPAKIAEAFKGLKVEGATGTIEYPENGDHNPNVPLAVVTIKDGKFTFVKTIDPTDVPAP